MKKIIIILAMIFNSIAFANEPLLAKNVNLTGNYFTLDFWLNQGVCKTYGCKIVSTKFSPGSYPVYKMSRGTESSLKRLILDGIYTTYTYKITQPKIEIQITTFGIKKARQAVVSTALTLKGTILPKNFATIFNMYSNIVTGSERNVPTQQNCTKHDKLVAGLLGQGYTTWVEDSGNPAAYVNVVYVECATDDGVNAIHFFMENVFSDLVP